MLTKKSDRINGMKFNKTRVSFMLFIVVGVTLIVYLSTVNYKSRAIVGGKTFSIDVADTTFTMSKGLSGRKSISKDEGMVFVFEKLDKHGFWMKDMLFPIDILWMDENFKIVHIEKSVSPETYPTIFSPDRLSLYVLEISAGQTDSLGVKVGDRVDFVYKNSI
ncbi:MAG: hypothetical protein CEO12_428 [Parcubacteria group bacterium Gr01-1014_46]|nr:MAG: hypothetical protein CEO12_428 [Parcubacteria group bacterium Gr01-1014_46]